MPNRNAEFVFALTWANEKHWEKECVAIQDLRINSFIFIYPELRLDEACDLQLHSDDTFKT